MSLSMLGSLKIMFYLSSTHRQILHCYLYCIAHPHIYHYFKLPKPANTNEATVPYSANRLPPSLSIDQPVWYVSTDTYLVKSTNVFLLENKQPEQEA